MKRAYSDLYLRDAMRTLAGSFDAAVYTYDYELPEYYRIFSNSTFAMKFETGDPFVISGESGIELAEKVISQHLGEDVHKQPIFNDDKTPEYWLGWALAYYQWHSACSFKTLAEIIPVENMLNMYSKYHQMDITQFVDRMDELRRTSINNTKSILND